jgi:hypothetical protein
MNIVMTLLVRDEEDIIRENIEFHLSQGVKYFIVTDNRSVDNTTDILREYEKEGIVRYIFEGDDNYDQHKWVTRMAVMAFAEYGADWVINNDADEFWWPVSGDLVDTFKRIPSDTNLVEADRMDFVMLEGSDLTFYERMVYKKLESLNSLGRKLPPKVAHRGSAEIKVAQGNHSVTGFKNSQRVRRVIDILHFPMRSPTQFVNKIKKGGAAYERNETLPERTGSTWRTLYSEYLKNNNLDDYCLQRTYSDQRIKEGLLGGTLVIDRRLDNYLSLKFAGRKKYLESSKFKSTMQDI